MASEAVNALAKALTEVSWTAGTCQVPEDELILFYGKDKTAASRLDFTNATQEEFEHLEQTCSPASFGRGGEDVLDGSYRKAGKLDFTEFSSTFSLEQTSILTHVKADLAQGDKGILDVVAKLYKLNVYGKGDFFERHKDTPRSENMSASLVVVFPTAHEGGALELSQNDKFFAFDAARMLAKAPKWSVAYVAFFSDIDHEVATVTSGHRVTLTYNLYFKEKPEPLKDWAAGSTVTSHHALLHDHALRNAVKSLLKQPEYDTSTGVQLLFGLTHQYPLNGTDRGIPWRDFAPMLKGSDKALFTVCQDFGLKVDLKVLHWANDDTFDGGSLWLCNFVYKSGDEAVENLEEELCHYGTFVGHASGEPCDENCDNRYHDSESAAKFKLVIPAELNGVEGPYVAYGNQAELQYSYGEIVLVVSVSGNGGDGTESE